MSASFDNAFKIVIENEGGISDLKGDKGGLTKYGISQRSYPNLDIANLTLKDAKAIYEKDFWFFLNGDLLPNDVAVEAFDAAVNCGIGTGIMLLQRACGVKADGVMGAGTLKAIRSMAPATLYKRLISQRLKYYTSLGDFDRFGRGWINRIANNLNR